MSDAIISELLQTCREVEAWCASKHVSPGYRTEALRPSVGELPTFDQLGTVLETVVSRRLHLAAGDSIPKSVGGRLLACEFNSSFASGESEHASAGFFDIDDRPAWDTWVFVLKSGSGEPILLSWVPKVLVDRVEAGISMNPYGCIYWLQDAPPEVVRLPLIRALRRATEASI